MKLFIIVSIGIFFWCFKVTSSYAATRLLFVQRIYQTYGNRLRGSVYIPAFTLIINEHVVSDQTYNRPHNSFHRFLVRIQFIFGSGGGWFFSGAVDLRLGGSTART